MVPYNQLAVSNYLVNKFIQNSANYCDTGCNCIVDRQSA